LTERYYRDKNNWPEPDVVAKINVHRKDATMGGALARPALFLTQIFFLQTTEFS
jgi:hypothetical protein